ncbi:MAG: outer membrane protein assembly factor BamB family protein, partial [Candidatus Thorarchaeota archaeon]
GSFLMDADHLLSATCDLRVLWRFHAPHAGYYCSPAVGEDGTIYFSTGSYSLASGYQPGEVYAVNPDGTLKWSYSSARTFFSPAIGENGWIYVMDHDYKVYALSPEGTLIWTFDDFEYTFVKRDMGQRTPAIGADGTVYVGADGLYALDPETGEPRWHFIRPPGTRECIASPIVGDDNTIYVTIGQDTLYAINPDGSRKWAFGFDNPYELTFATPAIDASGVIYVPTEAYTGESKVYAISQDGTLRWKYYVEGSRYVRGSPAIGEDGTIYVATKAVSKAVPARVIALSPSGTEIWHLDIPTIHETPDDIYSSPTVGADGTIYFGCETGKLYAVSSDGVMLWDHMLVGINWSSPAIIGDGTLYVAGIDDGMLYTGALCAVVTTSHGLATSPWPRFHHDNRNTGRFGAR